MHLTANISIPQKNFIAIDLHSDNAVICVRRNALNKAGELVGKNIWCGRVSIRDGLDNFIKVLVLSSAMTFFQGKRNETFPERFTIVS